jgi:hypothetical protein
VEHEAARVRPKPKPKPRAGIAVAEANTSAVAGARAIAGAGDAPAVRVELHVVEAAQQHTPVEIGAALILLPLVDVMRLAIRRWPIAAGPPAAPVPDRERDALPSRVEPLLPPHVQRTPRTIDRHRHDPARTGLLRDHPGRHDCGVVLETSGVPSAGALSASAPRARSLGIYTPSIHTPSIYTPNAVTINDLH